MTKLTKNNIHHNHLPKSCKWCKATYTPTHGLSRFCSSKCKHDAQIEYKRDRYAKGFVYRKSSNSRYFPKPCTNCKDIFTPTSGRDHLCSLCKTKRPAYKEDVVSALLRSCKDRYKNSCDLTREWVEGQWSKQKGLCALSGVSMSRMRSQGAGNIFGTDGTKVSIDRIDPDKSYTIDNCRLVCVIANLMRHRQTDKQLIWWCEQILKHNKII